MDAAHKSSLPKHLSQASLAAEQDLTGSVRWGEARPDPSVLLGSERDAEFGRLFLAAMRRHTHNNNNRPKRSKTQLRPRPNAK